MRFDVITIFPEMYGMLNVSKIWTRAQQSGIFQLHVHDLRHFSDDKHNTVDDTPYGGGPGMVMKIEPLVKAVESISNDGKRKVLFASPQGRVLTQNWICELSESSHLVFVSGRYEGVDERFIEGWVDESFSVGDYILSGGDLPIMVLLEAISRLLPGVVGDEESVMTDSFTSGMLKFPQYTRPADYRGNKVPEILLSGNHSAIKRWREERSFARTEQRRPELLHKTFVTRKAEKDKCGCEEKV